MRRLGLDAALALDADFAQEGFRTFPGDLHPEALPFE